KGVIYSRRMVQDRNRAEKGRKAVSKRWAQGAENLGEKPRPNRSPNRSPITQKPEARSQSVPFSKEKETPKTRTRASAEVPDWVPPEPWAGFVAMRRKIKKPLTDRAITMAVNKLAELKQEGQDVAAVLDQSTLRCWQDLYPVKRELVSAHEFTGPC